MASRKNFKKVITYIADQLATQAFFASYESKADAAEWIDVFNKIFALNKEYISRASHVEPRRARASRTKIFRYSMYFIQRRG